MPTDRRIIRKRLRIVRWTLLIPATILLLWACSFLLFQQRAGSGGTTVLINGQSFVGRYQFEARGKTRPFWTKLAFQFWSFERREEAWNYPSSSLPDYEVLAIAGPRTMELREVATGLKTTKEVEWLDSSQFQWSENGTAIWLIERSWPDYFSSPIPVGDKINILDILPNLPLIILQMLPFAVASYGLIFVLTSDRIWFYRRSNECKSCGYDLRGTTGPRCPECGVARPGASAETD